LDLAYQVVHASDHHAAVSQPSHLVAEFLALASWILATIVLVYDHSVLTLGKSLEEVAPKGIKYYWLGAFFMENIFLFQWIKFMVTPDCKYYS